MRSLHHSEPFTPHCSLELDERKVRKQTGWLPRNSQLIFIREPNLHGWVTRWFALLWDEGQFITVPVLSQAIIVSTSASNQTWTIDPTWNDAFNTVQVLGNGGAGGGSTGANGGAGGAGGGYSKSTNVILGGANPTFFLGPAAAGHASLKGDDGTDVWFNGTTLAGSSCGAHGGGGGNPTGGAAGVGGSTTGAIGTTQKQKGGDGSAPGGGPAGGGGGSGGPSGDGGLAGTSQGGTADGGTVSGGGNNSNGNSGTEFDGTHGCGSGAGGRNATTGNGFIGGNYGGAGSGAKNSGTLGGAGAIGIIVLTWTPALPVGPRRMIIYRRGY